jgi:hopanoid biosynthesis associated protein HpnK
MRDVSSSADPRRLAITADDFGLAKEVNEAVEIAHRKGVLSAASLMVTGAAADHAIAMARRLPSLRVGLHLTLVDERPALHPMEIAMLVGPDGRLRGDMERLAVDLAWSADARRQLKREMEAQFEAFRKSGLELDHVNAHKHFHVHPIVSQQLLSVGPSFGMRALRAPFEPSGVLAKVERARGAPSDWSKPWAALLRWRARKAGLRVADAVFGIRWSGGMSTERLAGLLRHVPKGFCEIYLHPAVRDDFPGSAEGYRYVDELTALCSEAARDAVQRSGARLTGYMDGAVSSLGRTAAPRTAEAR